MSAWRIIGSTAAYHWFPDWRRPKDLDILTPATISGNQSGVCVVDAQWHELADDLIKASSDPVFLDPSLLYTLKASHAYWDIHWDKTMHDIWSFQQRGVDLDQGLHDRLVKMWAKVHGEKRVNLNQTVDIFWNDAVKRRYDHEWLHRQVKFYDHPLHESLHPEGSGVLIDKVKFFSLPFDLQLKVAMEEILTVAIERADLGVQSLQHERLAAVKRAHKKLCTTMAKGWFAQFCVINAHRLVGDRSYWLPHFNHVIDNLPQEQP